MRRFEFPVDSAHAKAVNEAVADVRRVRVVGIIAVILLTLLAAWLFWLHHAWSYLLAVAPTIGAATALWVAIHAPSRVGSLEKLYAEGALVPAIVADIRAQGVTLLALIDVSRPTTNGTRYALVARNVHTLPGHEIKQGERIPAIAVVGDRDKPAGDMWQLANAMPIAWGTTDATVIDRAITHISDVEWDVLATKVDRSNKALSSKEQRVLLDPHELPDELRNP
ncbi:DUF3239 domain-containing protein [Antrihabitans cavernicola]|uniref:DUF3239 domain-containing protein n=1 Tax=Antrihabitans cavernicola TaxID=2495913 RepID=A0A5A7S7Q4_9NOCA|nr:DUF3239 domain-containing protein [Spelaeibacter cavernicola]KAA0021229.1 DUF3239 domain-containing protein [Spelaeibacter cavernicola]